MPALPGIRGDLLKLTWTNIPKWIVRPNYKTC